LTTAAMTFASKKADDYLGTNGAALVNRPLFYFQNNTSNVAECLASGAWAFCTGAVSLIPATSAGGATIHGGTGDTLTNDPMIAFSKVSSTANRLAWKVGITSNGTAQSDFIFRSKTTASSAESDPAFYTEVFRIGFSGACTIGASGASGTKVSVNSSSGAMPSICNSRTMSVYNDADAFGIQAVNGFASYTGVMISAYSVRASSNLFSFISCVTGDGASGYNVANAFVVAGDGTVRAGDSGSFAITPIGEHRFYSSIAQTSFGSVDVFDTRTQTTGVGGMISFSGFKIAQTNGAIYAGIKGSKFNATSNNELGQLKFYSSDGSSLKEGGFLDPFSGWVFGLPLGSAQPSFPFKPFIIQTPVSTTAIGFTKFHKISTGTSAVDLVTITSASWDSGHNLVIYVEAFNISTGTYSIVKGIATSNGATASNAINVAATDINNNGLGLGSFAWSAGTGAATLRYTPPTNTDSTVYEITINNRKFPFTLP